MATLNFTGTDRKVFTPVSSTLGNLSNGAGTIIVLVRKTVLGATDYAGLLNSVGNDWFHSLNQATGTELWDDDGLVGASASASASEDTTNWWWYAGDWPAGAAQPRFHWRNHTAGGAWSHANSATNQGATRAGPGTSGHWRVGYLGEASTGSKDMAVAFCWAGTRFSDSDYGSWTKTSDLWNHALGTPTFATQLNTATPSDLAGGSTYSSGNSTGTTLTGADPDNFTFDGLGSATAAPAPFSTFTPIPFMGGH